MSTEPQSFSINTHFLRLSNSGNKLEAVKISDGKVDEKFHLQVDSLSDIGQGGPDSGVFVKVMGSEFVVIEGEIVTVPLCDTPIDTREVNIHFDGERLGGIGISDIRQLHSAERIDLTYFIGACNLILAVEVGDPKVLHLFSNCDDLVTRPSGQACMEIGP